MIAAAILLALMGWIATAIAKAAASNTYEMRFNANHRLGVSVIGSLGIALYVIAGVLVSIVAWRLFP